MFSLLKLQLYEFFVKVLKKVVPKSEIPKVIFSLFETVKRSISISLRNLCNSLKSIKENAMCFLFLLKNASWGATAIYF